MPSLAWQNWVGVRAAALDDLEAVHRALRGTRPGVRTATQQVNQAYALLLAAHFQAFCRDLPTECVDALVPSLAYPAGHALVRRLLLLDRNLDRGNPNPGNIGSDFGRLGVPFWTDVLAHRTQNAARRRFLQDLCEWRNAVAHQDFAPGMLRGGRAAVTLTQVQTWRRACEGLALSFDEVLHAHLEAMAGVSPWT